MAEGGKQHMSLKDSFSKASGDADESFCDPCKTEGKWIAVEGFCQICDEYLCENCLGVHRKQRITRSHVILDKKQMPIEQRSVSKQDLCIEVCKTHHPEIVRFYCTAHDETGCGDCMTLKHTSCNKKRVQDISDGFQKTKEFKDVDQTLQQLHQELKEIEDVLDNNLKNLDSTYNNILCKITSVRKQVNEYLDQVQKKITDEAAQMKKEDETKLKTVHAENQAMTTEIGVIIRTIHDSNVNVNSLFVITKQAKQRLGKLEKMIDKIKHSQQQQYEFLISNEIEKIISAKTPLGKLSRKSQQKVLKMIETEDQTTLRTPIVDYSATFNRCFNMKRPTDNKTCRITDCTLLSPDRMVIIDNANINVKLIDLSNNKFISSYSTSGRPSHVTALSTNMIAVTLPLERKIQLLDVTTTFTLQREINVNNDCYGIAYKDGKLAVCYKKTCGAEILDLQGKLLHTIQPKQGKNNILQRPEYIIFGQENDTVIVSDFTTNTVNVVTYGGQILQTYTELTLSNPQGMSMTADGVLFVCSWGNGCIYVVSQDFKRSKIIINGSNGGLTPKSIAYCDINHRLYISNAFAYEDVRNNRIQIYDLHV